MTVLEMVKALNNEGINCYYNDNKIDIVGGSDPYDRENNNYGADIDAIARFIETAGGIEKPCCLVTMRVFQFEKFHLNIHISNW